MKKSTVEAQLKKGKAETRIFLKNWKRYLQEERYAAAFKAIADAGYFLDLDSIPFLIACTKCSDRINQVAALGALGNKLSQEPVPKGVKALFDAFYNDTHPLVRGVALSSLGRIARKHKIRRVLPLLLSVVSDHRRHNQVRLNAYFGLIYLFDKEFTGPQYRTWQMTYDKPADEQIDWVWLKELQSKAKQAKRPRSIARQPQSTK